MRTRGLALSLPPHSISPPGAAGGILPRRPIAPGDFLLGRAHGRKHQIIKSGQLLHLRGADRAFAGYTHAALVASAAGDLVEAVGTGVHQTSLKQYVIDEEEYLIVRIEASDEARRLVVEFATHEAEKGADYAALATVSATLWAIAGFRLTFTMDGSHTCSGLVAEALKRMGARFDINAAKITPAQLAVIFKAPPSPH